jgi:hypothetical protein
MKSKIVSRDEAPKSSCAVLDGGEEALSASRRFIREAVGLPLLAFSTEPALFAALGLSCPR